MNSRAARRGQPLGSIMVVDDDPIALQITRERLEALGYSVTTRGVALGTVELVFRDKPDCLLLDVDMPALSGSGLAQLLKRGRTRSDVRVILHSGLPKQELDRLVAESGADGAIQKTSDDAVFNREFRLIMGRARPGVRT